MKVRHLQESDKQYRVFLYMFYVSSAMMIIIMIYGMVMMVEEWQENGTYIMGEVLVNTHVPFENFANLTTWLSFACIISWYCVSRIGWKKTVGLQSYRMALLQLMLLGFALICLYEVLWSFTVLNSEITSQMVIDGTVPDIDRLAVHYPDPERPWNLIFATKIWLVGFMISAHAFYLSTRPRKTKEELVPEE
ncbi:MAG: hypothetical protein O3C04_06370 [Crenarchaeota archaeon]|nr:hypothetical protein [Thermoproteota archaeon]MDA1125246.1 hypothetical protein [Thermoproteota archaeon]